LTKALSLACAISALPQHACSATFIGLVAVFSWSDTYGETQHNPSILSNTDNASHTQYVRCYNTNSHLNDAPQRWVCREPNTQSSTDLDTPDKHHPAAFDFVPTEHLSIQDSKFIPAGCSGIYQPPAGFEQTSAIGELQHDLIIEANTSRLEGTKSATLTGDVFVQQGPRVVRADSMLFDNINQSATLSGGVAIRNPGVIIRGEQATMSTIKNAASFDQAMFVLHNQHMRGSAASITQSEGGMITLNRGQITSCEPNQQGWTLSGSEIKVDYEKGQGSGKNITLRLGSVPVLYTPYIAFPLGDERKSGFLFPEISSTDNGGLDLALPYYFNLAPNYDATVTPRLISGRGAMLGLEGRYLSSKFYNEANVGFLPQDDGGGDADLDTLIASGNISENEARPHQNQNRWVLQFNQEGGATSQKGWYSSINFTRVSDIDYFRDIGDSAFDPQNESFVTQRLEAGYLFDHWTVSTLIENNQVLLRDLDNPYKKEPQITANGQYRHNGLHYTLSNDLTRFGHANQTFRNGQTVLTGTRLATDYRIAKPYIGRWGFIKPQLGYKALAYVLDNDGLNDIQDNSPAVGAAQASLDLGLVFENNSGRFYQTFEPRAYLLFREFSDHDDLFNVTDDNRDINFDTSLRTFSFSQLFRDSRFSGKDRLDDASQATLGFTARWMDKSTQAEKLNISMGQVFHFRDRRIGLRGSDQETEQTSELAADMQLYLGETSQYYLNTIYDTESKRITRANSGITYAQNDSSTLYNVSYSYVRDYRQASIAAGTTNATDIDQIDLAMAKPLSPQWQIMGRYNYDFTQKQELEAFVGFEYNDCCYRLLMLARHWLDSNIASLTSNDDLEYDRGIFFELHLKGLGGSGKRVTSILKDSIRGYRERN